MTLSTLIATTPLRNAKAIRVVEQGPAIDVSAQGAAPGDETFRVDFHFRHFDARRFVEFDHQFRAADPCLIRGRVANREQFPKPGELALGEPGNEAKTTRGHGRHP